ncbi:MAG: hypothetical protein ACI7YS_00060 [Flavobacterium sp.]
MKKHIYIGILFICFWNVPVCLGQVYHFDKLVQYKGVFDSGKYKTTLYFNSKDNSYYFASYVGDQFSTSFLHDKKKEELHYYEISNLAESKSIQYKSSRKLSSSDEDPDCKKCSAKETELNSLTSKITFETLEEFGEKRRVEIIAKKVNYFVPTIGTDLGGYICFSCSKPPISRFKLPTSLTITNNSEVTHKEKLILEQDINIDFQVDEKNIKYTN